MTRDHTPQAAGTGRDRNRTHRGAATVADVVRITLDRLTHLGIITPDQARADTTTAALTALGVTTTPPPAPPLQER